jgi:hypothetical protein
MHIQITPSRILNDNRGIFGLWMSDFAGAIVIFILLSSILDGTPFAVFSLPLAVLALVPLIPLRLSTRRKIVRDTLIAFLTPKTLFEVKKHALRN